ncbi:MAG: hypothetical protein HZC10_03630 [Nitrospirae bacterium]|nr:hypothetical protein [Nitrospirota bacterium]
MDALTILVTIVFTIFSYGAAGIFIYGFLLAIQDFNNTCANNRHGRCLKGCRRGAVLQQSF